MPESKKPADDSSGVPDAENPESTREQMANAVRFKDLPASLQAKLSAIQEAARMRRGSLAESADGQLPTTSDLDAERQMELARIVMDTRREVLRRLAK